jgi:hypothetical protein
MDRSRISPVFSGVGRYIGCCGFLESLCAHACIAHHCRPCPPPSGPCPCPVVCSPTDSLPWFPTFASRRHRRKGIVSAPSCRLLAAPQHVPVLSKFVPPVCAVCTACAQLHAHICLFLAALSTLKMYIIRTFETSRIIRIRPYEVNDFYQTNKLRGF